MLFGICSKILPRNLRAGLIVLLFCASLTVIFVWNQLEAIETVYSRKSSHEDEFEIALKRFAELRKHATKKQKIEAAKALKNLSEQDDRGDDDTTEPDLEPKTTKKPPPSANLPKSENEKISGNLGNSRFIPEEIAEEEGCPAWKPDWKALSKIQSSINLDPNRFLIPVLTYGPNNQLRGFRETIFLAIKLNRTVVPPPFYKHGRTDESQKDDEDDLSLIVPPWQRIDLSSMSSTMSTLDPMSLSSHCGRHFDVFFKTKPFYCSGGNILRFESLLKYLNMEWEPGNHLYKDKGACQLNKTIPEDSVLPTNGGPIHLSSSKDVLESFYKSDEKCALWIFPYHCIQFKSVLKAPGLQMLNDGFSINPDDESESDLMQHIIRATPRPKYLRNIASSYVTNKIKNDNFLAIHWRYNHGDWLRHCEHHPSPACTAVLETIGHPEEIAQQIALYLRKRPHLKALYIAAPLEEADLIENIRKELNGEFPIFTGETLLQYMFDTYPNCQWMKDNFHDIFSSLEQEICSLSDTFLYAAGSSWSLNILMERHAAGKVLEEKNEENIHLLFQVLKVLNIHMDEKGNILG